MKGYVYKLTSPSGKCYIGITNNFKRRMAEHRRYSKTIINRKIYIAMRKYGFDEFKVEILEEYNIKDESKLLEKLNERETYFIDKYNSFVCGYNCTLGGDGTKGASGELNPFYGKKHNAQTRKKMSEAREGMKLSEEHKKNIGLASTGRKHSSESKVKMSKAQREAKAKSVICLDTGNVYECITDCANDVVASRSDIRKVCNGERMTCKGMRFRFIENGEVVNVEACNKVKRPIMCIETKVTFGSIQDACNEYNVKHQHIWAILNGKQKTTKGYSFKYL